MKTAQTIPRIGLAKAKGEHLIATNDEPKSKKSAKVAPARMQLFLDKNWRYVRSEATDIRKTFARVMREQKGRK